MDKVNWNELRDRAYQNAVKHGWYDEESMLHHLMMFVTELGEVVNADRIGKSADRIEFDKIFEMPSQDPKFHFSFCYEAFIKDTLEDELADAAIRLLSLAGFKKYDIDSSSFTEKSFKELSVGFKPHRVTEILYSFLIIMIDKKRTLSDLLYCIIALAHHLQIDLLWHIEQKMKYNEMRPFKHGKKY